jgi:hypothetical protein
MSPSALKINVKSVLFNVVEIYALDLQFSSFLEDAHSALSSMMITKCANIVGNVACIRFI